MTFQPLNKQICRTMRKILTDSYSLIIFPFSTRIKMCIVIICNIWGKERAQCLLSPLTHTSPCRHKHTHRFPETVISCTTCKISLLHRISLFESFFMHTVTLMEELDDKMHIHCKAHSSPAFSEVSQVLGAKRVQRCHSKHTAQHTLLPTLPVLTYLCVLTCNLRSGPEC